MSNAARYIQTFRRTPAGSDNRTTGRPAAGHSVHHRDMQRCRTPGYKVQGRDEAMRLVRGSVEHAKTSHHVHSPEIEFHGDSADVIWAMQDRVVWPEDRAKKMGNWEHTGYGQYLEHYVRCPDGRWRSERQQLRRFHVDVHVDPPR